MVFTVHLNRAVPLRDLIIGHEDKEIIKRIRSSAKRGIDVNQMTLGGYSTMGEAVFSNRVKVARALLKFGKIDINKPFSSSGWKRICIGNYTNENLTYLMLAIEFGCNFDMIKLLVDNGADISIKRSGKTAYELAKSYNLDKKITNLLKPPKEPSLINNFFKALKHC